MSSSRQASASVFLALCLVLSACASPAVYKPEVDAFQTATAQTSAFMDAKRKSIRHVRSELRSQELAARRPLLRIGGGCTSTVAKYRNSSQSGAGLPLTATDVSGCELALANGDEPQLQRLMNPPKVLDNSAAFMAAVSAYAESLQHVATAGDQQSFVAAFNELADNAASVATSAAKAADSDPPDVQALTPIANLVGQAIAFYLEGRRAEALKAGAQAANPWIEQGSRAVAKVMYSAQFEIINAQWNELTNQIDKVNEANQASYVAAADKAIVLGTDLRRELAADPGAPFRALPVAHEKLLEAFGDRERNLSGSIAASKALFVSAKEATTALVQER